MCGHRQENASAVWVYVIVPLSNRKGAIRAALDPERFRSRNYGSTTAAGASAARGSFERESLFDGE